ncbi:MAG: NAD-dependent epimerase/dehydratase family protein [Gemmatimonadota bacterium]
MEREMRVLVIGGSGHVSGAVVRAALAGGHEVWAVTRGQKPRTVEGVTWLQADRHLAGAMEAAVAGQDTTWDLVVDCIAYDVPDIRQDVALFRARARHLVFISTDFVYDPSRRTFPQTEATEAYVTVADGTQEYGRKKRLCELELQRADTGPMAWTVLRPCHIYGPTSELGCLPRHGRDPELVERLRRGEALALVGGGHFLQQPVLADDLALTALSAGGNSRAAGAICNLAGPDIVESRQYYQLVADALGTDLQVEEVPVQAYRRQHPEHEPFLCHRVYDLSRLAACGLAAPSTPLAEGLRRHVDGLLARRGRAAG